MERHEMIENFQKLFHKRSARVLAQQELEDSHKKLLEVKANREYYASMESCLESRIRRLKAYIKNEED
jgi:hypothetical protein